MPDLTAEQKLQAIQFWSQAIQACRRAEAISKDPTDVEFSLEARRQAAKALQNFIDRETPGIYVNPQS